MQRRAIYIIVFITGLCVTTIEIAAARIVAPFFGSTIYVWGSAIGVVLLGLAIGYPLGGVIIDRHPKEAILRITLFIASLTALCIPWSYELIGQSLVHWSSLWHTPIAFCAFIMMVTLFLIPITALGMVSPIALRLSVTSVQRSGTIGGLLSGLATAGSIAGTFLSAFWLIPEIGTRLTIVITAGMLLVMATILQLINGLNKSRLIFLFFILLFATSILVMHTPEISRPGVVWEKESAYQLVQVTQIGDYRFLVHDANFAVQSEYLPSATYSHSPYDVFGILPYMIPSKDKPLQVLVIGLGGGNIPRLFDTVVNPDIPVTVTAVEIDPVVVTAANKYFGLKDLPLTVVVDDARHYLQTTPTTFDIIIVDAYTHETQIPPMLATKEFFTEVHDHLTTGGMVGINAFAPVGGRYLPKLLSTVAAVFPDTREAPFTSGAINHIIIGADSLPVDQANQTMPPLLSEIRDQLFPRLRTVPKNADIYTDDRTDLDIRVRPLLQ